MSINDSKSVSLLHSEFVDVLLVAVMSVISAIFHVLAFPLHVLNPIFAPIAGLTLVRDHRNSHLIALAMP